MNVGRLLALVACLAFVLAPAALPDAAAADDPTAGWGTSDPGIAAAPGPVLRAALPVRLAAGDDRLTAILPGGAPAPAPVDPRLAPWRPATPVAPPCSDPQAPGTGAACR